MAAVMRIRRCLAVAALALPLALAAALPGARHDMGAAREHGLIDALHTAGARVIADNGYRGSGFRFMDAGRARTRRTRQAAGLTLSPARAWNRQALRQGG